MQAQPCRARKNAWITGKVLLITSIYSFNLLLLFILNLGQGFSASTGQEFYTVTVSLSLVLFPLSVALLAWAKQRLTPLIMAGLLVTFASAAIAWGALVPFIQTPVDVQRECFKVIWIDHTTELESIFYHYFHVGIHSLPVIYNCQ